MSETPHTKYGLTDYHAKYFAWELTKRCPSDSVEKLAGALAGAQVDLNPHQIDAAMFAFHSPLSKGALLADEVGLGKTIEAGLVLSQKWAERKRRILIIVPSNLRKQWYQELTEKFFLPCRIIESKSYNAAVKVGNFRPFITSEIVICSYQFARSKAPDVQAIAWDLVVMDEAHRLRNVYKPSNVIANTLKMALAGKNKLLLTATPLQNSLLELFGLVSFIDEHAFGDLKSFRDQFSNVSKDGVFELLKQRLRPICHRTLRRQVLPYVRYTKRLPLVQPFEPAEAEDRLYDLVSDYLRRSNLQALPSSQRSLMTLVLRKLLASSSFAIAGALETLSKRLQAELKKQAPEQTLEEVLDEDYEVLDETAEEWPEEPPEPLSPEDIDAIKREIADLEGFKRLALSIENNAKGDALLVALQRAFDEAERLGAARKAIIFTESRKTQLYLQRLLGSSPFNNGIVLFNGTNTDERSREIYNEWMEQHAGTDRASGSRTADMRSAIVDYFRDQGQIMIATEAGAEGINLQFCSLVVNYDLPWNPQRIEQRIGRAHRYGQQHDVVVVNFLNQNNEADQRVFNLLSEKFKLFEGVFGASDEVLGAVESGVDFEKRIADIYQRCRRPDEIQQAFDQLQADLGAQISEAMTSTRQKLLEHFDDEVREKLRVRDEASRSYLNKFENLLMRLTRYELRGHVDILNDSSFVLSSRPSPVLESTRCPLGLYELPRRSGEAHLYHLNHDLAQWVIENAKARELPSVEIKYDYEAHEGKVSILHPLLNKCGWLSLHTLTIEALDQAEDHLMFIGVADDGTVLDSEQCSRLLQIPGRAEAAVQTTNDIDIQSALSQLQAELLQQVDTRNARFYEAEVKKLDGWADDQIAASEKALKDIKRLIRELRNEAGKANDLTEQLRLQSEISENERKQRRLRQEIFEIEDRILAQRDELVASIRSKLHQSDSVIELFTIRWSLANSESQNVGTRQSAAHV